MVRFYLLLFLSLFLPKADAMNDESVSIQVDDSESVGWTSSGMKTLGGRQFWGDLSFFRGWRIQQNVFTQRCRLLDPNDERHCSGTLEECRTKLDHVIRSQKLPPMTGKAVILIHGIGRSSQSFSEMASILAEDGYTVLPFDYPSTRMTIPESAEFLHSTLQSLDGIESIDVVCHSMGGLLLRAYLMEHNDARFHRAVMLGVPNRGARVADALKTNPLFKAILGPAGQQLVSDDGALISQLPVPQFDFGVLAGGRSAARGFNPLLPTDNDSTVTVTSTRLPGASDFILLPVIHSFLMSDKSCIDATRCYLENGCFRKNQSTNPISNDDVTVIE